jgi:hypothetical protein
MTDLIKEATEYAKVELTKRHQTEFIQLENEYIEKMKQGLIWY